MVFRCPGLIVFRWAAEAPKMCPQPPILVGMYRIATITVTYTSVSLTNAIMAGARSPARKV